MRRGVWEEMDAHAQNTRGSLVRTKGKGVWGPALWGSRTGPLHCTAPRTDPTHRAPHRAHRTPLHRALFVCCSCPIVLSVYLFVRAMDRAPTLAVLIYLLLHGVGSSGSATTSGRGLLLDGTPRWMKGVTWNPVAAGGTHPADVDFSGFVAQDAALMRAAGVNVVRNYEPLRNPKVLDVLAEHGISLIASVYPWGGAAVTAVDDIVAATKDHPAVLMWYIGNEWNYNGLYVGLDLNASTARVAEVARRVKALDPSRPVATVYGEIPDVATFAALAEPIDLWGLNVYHGGSFGSLFDDWLVRSAGTPRPMFIAEYGADAWDSRGEGKYNPQAQVLHPSSLPCPKPSLKAISATCHCPPPTNPLFFGRQLGGWDAAVLPHSSISAEKGP